MRKLGRIAIWSGGVLLFVALVLGGIVYSFSQIFYPTVAPANFPKPKNVAEAQQQDLAYFRNYFSYDRAYSAQARAQAIQLLDRDTARAGAFSPAQFELAILRMVALADNGHSRVERGSMTQRHNRLPCRFYRFADGYYVVRARAACYPLLGDKVVAVDGRPVEKIASAMYAYAGGPRNHYDQFVSLFFLESPELLSAAGFAKSADRETLTVARSDGSTRDVAVIADPPDTKTIVVYSDSYLSPEKIDGEAADWKPLLAGKTLPYFLRDYTVPFRAAYWPERATYYAQFRDNESETGYPISDFIGRVEHEIAADKPRAIVLDMRLNQGGNFVTTAGLMKSLTTLSPSVEHIYVLTSAWTFSAGEIGVALAKDHGAGKVTIVGEPVGDRMRLWAEGNNMKLPNSRIDLHFATGLHDYTHPCTGQDGCFWTMLFFPMHVGSLQPDVPVPYRFADYMALRDPDLDRVQALEKARTP
jgi:hypothetical protein